jgi:hypothetical protein
MLCALPLLLDVHSSLSIALALLPAVAAAPPTLYAAGPGPALRSGGSDHPTPTLRGAARPAHRANSGCLVRGDQADAQTAAVAARLGADRGLA